MDLPQQGKLTEYWEYCELSLGPEFPGGERRSVVTYSFTDAVEVTSEVERLSFGQAVAYLGYRGWEAFHVDLQRSTWLFKRLAAE